ncbi:MAG: LysE family transporter [Pseudomonadota bacterium]
MFDYLTYPFFIFAGTLALSPGPVNLISLMFGASCNAARAAPFIVGGAAGFGAVWAVAAACTDFLNSISPATFDLIKYAALAYFLWLAYGIIQTKMPPPTGCTERQPGPVSGLVLALLNPQTSISAMLAAGMFLTQPTTLVQSAAFGLSYMAIVIAGTSLYLLAGTLFQQVLTHPAVFGIFRYSTAGLLVFVGARIL